MASGPIISWQIDGEKMATVTDFTVFHSKIPADSDCNHKIKRYLFLERKESDMTERLHFHFSLSCIGEGNGNPLQCSCNLWTVESQGRGSLVGCCLWGRIELDTTEAT